MNISCFILRCAFQIWSKVWHQAHIDHLGLFPLIKWSGMSIWRHRAFLFQNTEYLDWTSWCIIHKSKCKAWIAWLPLQSQAELTGNNLLFISLNYPLNNISGETCGPLWIDQTWCIHIPLKNTNARIGRLWSCDPYCSSKNVSCVLQQVQLASISLKVSESTFSCSVWWPAALFRLNHWDYAYSTFQNDCDSTWKSIKEYIHIFFFFLRHFKSQE